MTNPWFNDEQMGGHSDKPVASNPPDAPDTEEFLVPERTNGELLAIAKGAPKSDSGELDALLDRYGTYCRRNPLPDPHHNAPISQQKENASRRSVLDLFERLQNRIAELDEELKWMTDRILSARFLPEGSCGFFWRTDYGPAYCDQGKDHAGLHRCWGSQGEMRFDPLSSLRSSSLGEQTLTRGNAE